MFGFLTLDGKKRDCSESTHRFYQTRTVVSRGFAPHFENSCYTGDVPNTNILTPREKAIARQVRRARKESGLSQEAVGEALGLSVTGYGHYERARQPFSVDQLFQLSRVLGKPVEWFLGLDTGLTDDEAELLHLYQQIETPAVRQAGLAAIRGQLELDRELRGESKR